MFPSCELISPLTAPFTVIILCSAAHIWRSKTSITNSLSTLFSAHLLWGHTDRVFASMNLCGCASTYTFCLCEWHVHAYICAVMYVHVLVCVCMHGHVNKRTLCVCESVCLYLCDNGLCPSAHRTRAFCIRQKTHLMPVTGSDQVCTKENWFLWKTESNQGQFSHLPRSKKERCV